MSKITSEQLARKAVVYIRQSTPDQVANNLESKRRQYGLADRTRQLGWNDVAVIDDDLGRSGGRPRYDPSKPIRGGGAQAGILRALSGEHQGSDEGGQGLDLAYTCRPPGMPRMM